MNNLLYNFLMKQIIAKTAGNAWMQALKEVYTNGQAIKDGNENLKELLNVFLCIDSPIENDSVLQIYADPKMIEWMRNNFLKMDPVLNWGYSYGQRFFDYDGIDQVAKVIDKLKKNPESKSATVTLMNPKGDQLHMPCIVSIDFKIRDGQLITTAFFRSQDVGKKMYADIICIGEISKKIADTVGVGAGRLHILIASLHAYETDWKMIEKMIAA
jgi:thymidylate synthase